MIQTCILSIIASLLINAKAQPMSDVTTTILPWLELECPDGTTQIGSLNADIAGCGLEGCDKRYQDHYKTIEDCAIACNKNDACVSFTWAPLNGDQNHPGKTVCTLYNNNMPNRQWSPQQIMCALPKTPSPTMPLMCPYGTQQIGSLNADISGCGIEGCDKRYQDHYKTIQECKIGCDSNNKCISFTWAPLNGDQNHPGKTVCTLYDSKQPNQQWTPQQIMCASTPLPRLPAEVTLHCDNIGTLEISYDNAETFMVVATEDDWTVPMRASIYEASEDTVLRLTCEDQGVVGGFIATVKYDGIDYSTTEPIYDGYWKLIFSSDGDTSSLVYSSKGSDPWYINTENIEEDAVWIWNEHTYNTMVFEFDFKNLILGTMSYGPYNQPEITCQTSLSCVQWIVVMGVMLMVSVLINVYMCYTTQRKAAFAHTLVKDCDEVEGKSTDIVSV